MELGTDEHLIMTCFDLSRIAQMAIGSDGLLNHVQIRDRCRRTPDGGQVVLGIRHLAAASRCDQARARCEACSNTKETVHHFAPPATGATTIEPSPSSVF